jgi:hypothetical protein
MRIIVEAISLSDLHDQGIEITEAAFMRDGKPMGKTMVEAFHDPETDTVNIDWNTWSEDVSAYADVIVWVDREPRDIAFTEATNTPRTRLLGVA